MAPLAYFLTFRTYASWLPGDPRGYHARRAARSPPDQTLHASSEDALAAAPFLLSAHARTLVDTAIREHCAYARWTLHALHVRSNHVHVVVTATAPPERIMVQLKAWATRRLREAALLDRAGRAWAQHGSTRYLWRREAVLAAWGYVLEGQGAPLPSG